MPIRAHRFFTAVVVVGAAIGTGCSSDPEPAADAAVDAPMLADLGTADAGSIDANVSVDMNVAVDMNLVVDAGDIDEGIVLIL